MLTNPKWPLFLDSLGRKKITMKVSLLHILWDHDALLDKINKSNKLPTGPRGASTRQGECGASCVIPFIWEFQASEGHFIDRYGVHKNRCIRNSDPANFQKSKWLVLPRSQGQQIPVTSTAPLSFPCPTRTPLTELPSLFSTQCSDGLHESTRLGNRIKINLWFLLHNLTPL